MFISFLTGPGSSATWPSPLRPYERVDSLIDGEFTRFLGEERFKQDRMLLSSKLIKKFNARNIATVGILLEDHFIEYYEQYNSYFESTPGGDSLVLYPPRISRENNLVVFQSFLEWKHRFSNDLSFYGGLNFQYFFMNGTYSVEPRTSLKWRFKENQSLSIGYGLHSQLQPFFYYLVQTPLTDDEWDRDNYIQTNRDLGFTKSHHVALGYDYSISSNLRLKAEIYYQSLFNIPVESKESPLSLINALFGYELPLNDRSFINFNIRGVSAGGRRVIPLDEERTLEEGKSVYNLDESFELKLAEYYRLDGRIGYKLNTRRASHEIALDISNLTNHQNEFARRYNSSTNQFETRYQQGFFFVLYYRIRF